VSHHAAEIGVVGPGAIGGLLAARLSKARDMRSP
jgi:ketopantoate reductase